MDVLKSSFSLLAGHWRCAALEGGVFFVGLISAGIVLRYRIGFLAAFPSWLVGKLSKFLSGNPGVLSLFFVIVVFNSCAMFVYMMTGTLLHLLPTIICFLTGMNIGIVSGAMPAIAMAPVKREEETESSDSVEPSAGETNALSEATARAGLRRQLVTMSVVALLELPAFWFAVAMGTTLPMVWTLKSGAAFVEGLAPFITAYATVIVPVLTISAFVEALGIRFTLTARSETDSGRQP